MKNYLRWTMYSFWESIELRIKVRHTNAIHAEKRRAQRTLNNSLENANIVEILNGSERSGMGGFN